MSARPSGTVTFLFTDIEGSTARWEHFPAAMADALARHDALLHRAVEDAGGLVFKTVGDAFCAAFATAAAGVRAAIEAQRLLESEDWSVFEEGFPPLRVRMGLHTGEAVERGGDYFGQPVNRVARIEAAAHGGQLLLSSVVAGLVRDQLPEGIVLHDWGQHQLKDLRHSERIFQLRGTGLPAVDQAPATAERLNPRDRVRVQDHGSHPELLQSARSPSERTGAADEIGDRLEAALRSESGEAITLTAAEASELAQRKPVDWRQWCLGRVAEWSQPRYRLDGRFVGLSLMIDRGEESAQGRWQVGTERFGDLGELMAARPEPSMVLLGPPGGGKSTLLRRLELDLAIAGFRHVEAPHVSFFISLSTYRPQQAGHPLPDPGAWLGERWQARYPDLPALDDLLAAGRVTLLLDALNEMPTAGEAEFRGRVQRWKEWLLRLTVEHPGNRVIFSCRNLDYSQPLSTPELRVPQVRIEPMTDDQVRDFIRVYSPGRWREIWAALEGSAQLEVLRSPYFLALLVEQVESSGELPSGRAALFTGFVRQALRREVERDNPLFAVGNLISSRDLRRITGWRWKDPYDLPERGILLPKLSRLANRMQRDHFESERSQVRIDIDDALDLLDDDQDEAIVAAGAAMAILDEDQAAQELMFVHQLVQEYFAARQLAREPAPDLARAEWRSEGVRPKLRDVLRDIDPADHLPALAGTGWEETSILAAAMSEDPASFLLGLMPVNLGLAGRAATQAELADRLPPEVLNQLRWALVERSRDPEADLRDRITCARAAGEIGDPRFELREGPHGRYLLPPTVDIAGGDYPIGGDEALETSQGRWTDHLPAHRVTLKRYAIGRFPVTNAEWARFVEAGGYDDDRWWDSAAGKAWRRGQDTAAGRRAGVLRFVERCRQRPQIMEDLLAAGTWQRAQYDRARLRVGMSQSELEAHLAELYPDERYRQPAMWNHSIINGPAYPVVGICWYEARAYVNWLAAQSGLAFRLPTEIEWEAAARGMAARDYAFGARFDPLAANTWETHVKRPTPIGVFPSGDSPEGISDLNGNVMEWTSSAFGLTVDETDFPYPYRAGDGREIIEAQRDMQRVARGGSWFHDHDNARSVFRASYHPGNRYDINGMRVAIDR